MIFLIVVSWVLILDYFMELFIRLIFNEKIPCCRRHCAFD
jgi:hypothetical protein